MKKKTTIYDIAQKSGFSVGTVNRALNGKDRISPATKKHILSTADKLGYKINPAAQGLRRTQINIGAIVFCPIEEYVNSIVDGLSSAASSLEKYNVYVDIKKIDYTTSEKCLDESIKQIKLFAEKKYDGIVLFLSSTTYELKEVSALIDELTEKNIFFATVANDIPNSKRVIHVGLDAFMAGQMAAQLLEFSCADEDVALLVSSNDSQINSEYIKGFWEYSRDNAFSSVNIYEHYDNEDKIISVTEKLIRDNPNIKGIYMTTAASSIACKYINKTKKQDLHIITTDLLSDTPDILSKKMASATIFQNPFKQGKNVVNYLYQYIVSRKKEGVHLIAPHILLSSNITSYLDK